MFFHLSYLLLHLSHLSHLLLHLSHLLLLDFLPSFASSLPSFASGFLAIFCFWISSTINLISLILLLSSSGLHPFSPCCIDSSLMFVKPSIAGTKEMKGKDPFR